MRITTSSPGMHSNPSRAGDASPQVHDPNAPPPLETVLFGARRPKVVNAADFPQLVEQLRWLLKQKAKIATFVGDKDEEYGIVLSEGLSACIDHDGRIYFGVALLERAKRDPALIAGILAHEIGHRPKTWKRLKHGHTLKRAELAELARLEEAKADQVAGRALAELGFLPDSLCFFLEKHGHFEKQPENYFETDIRIELIRDAHAAQVARSETAKKLFPNFQRERSVKGMIDAGKITQAPKKKRRIARSF